MIKADLNRLNRDDCNNLDIKNISQDFDILTVLFKKEIVLLKLTFVFNLG
jgi:hypothetical protein